MRHKYTGLAYSGRLQAVSATIEAIRMLRAVFTSHRLRDFFVLEERTECGGRDFKEVNRAF